MTIVLHTWIKLIQNLQIIPGLGSKMVSEPTKTNFDRENNDKTSLTSTHSYPQHPLHFPDQWLGMKISPRSTTPATQHEEI